MRRPAPWAETPTRVTCGPPPRVPGSDRGTSPTPYFRRRAADTFQCVSRPAAGGISESLPLTHPAPCRSIPHRPVSLKKKSKIASETHQHQGHHLGHDMKITSEVCLFGEGTRGVAKWFVSNLSGFGQVLLNPGLTAKPSELQTKINTPLKLNNVITSRLM